MFPQMVIERTQNYRDEGDSRQGKAGEEPQHRKQNVGIGKSAGKAGHHRQDV